MNRLFTSFCLFTILSTGILSAQNPRQLERSAQAHYQRKEYLDAIKDLVHALKIKPRHKDSQEAIVWMFPKSIEACKDLLKKSEETCVFIDSGTESLREKEEKKLEEKRKMINIYKYINALNAEVKSLPPIELRKENRMLEFDIEDQGLNIMKVTREIEQMKETIAEEYYNEGLLLMAEDTPGKQKAAAKKFAKAQEYIPKYKDAAELYEQARKAAVQRVAVVPFENKSGKGHLGAVEETLADMLTASLVASEFVDVISRAELEQVLAEQKLELSGVIDDNTAVEVGKILGVNYIITGKITQIATNNPSTQVRSIQDSKQITIYADTGEEVTTGAAVVNMIGTLAGGETRKTREKTVNALVTEYTQIATAKISGSYKLIDIETAQIKETSAYTEKAEFKSQWGGYTGDKRALSPQNVKLCQQQQQPVPSSEEMVSTCIEKLAKSLTNDINKYLN